MWQLPDAAKYRAVFLFGGLAKSAYLCALQYSIFLNKPTPTMAEPTLEELIYIAKQKLELAKAALGKTPYTILADQTSSPTVQTIIDALQNVIDLVTE
jgi:hypothetical protein